MQQEKYGKVKKINDKQFQPPNQMPEKTPKSFKIKDFKMPTIQKSCDRKKQAESINALF